MLLVGFLGACTLPEAPIHARDPDFPVPARWTAYAQADPKMVDSGWVSSFNSRVLEQLVADAIARNRDIRAAEARLVEARALARQAGAPLIPGITAELGVSREEGGSTEHDAVLRVAWEADLWGRVRGDRAAAALDAVAESAIFEFTRQSIAAAVADTWIVLNGQVALREIARQELAARRSALAAVEERVAANVLLAVDANYARAEVARAQDRLVAAEGAIQQATRALEVLTGRYPANQLNVATGLPRLPGPVPAGLPSQLLERRPDVVAADRRIAAAFYRTHQAQAARLPRLTLAANLTGTGGSIGSALDPANIVWTLAAGLIAPIIDGGALREQVNIQNARQQQALAQFGATALQAFREVETALANEQVLRRRLALLNSATDELLRATNLERERFEAAEIDLQRLDDVRLRYFTSLRERNAVQVELLRNRVALHLALGGSFARPAPEVARVAQHQPAAQ